MDFSSRRYWEIEKCTYYIRRAGDTRKLDTTYASWRSRQTLPRGKPRILNIRSRVPGVFIRAAVNPRAAQETKSCARKIVHDCARQSLLSSLNVIENRCTKSTLVFRYPPSSIKQHPFSPCLVVFLWQDYSTFLYRFSSWDQRVNDRNGCLDRV